MKNKKKTDVLIKGGFFQKNEGLEYFLKNIDKKFLWGIYIKCSEGQKPYEEIILEGNKTKNEILPIDCFEVEINEIKISQTKEIKGLLCQSIFTDKKIILLKINLNN